MTPLAKALDATLLLTKVSDEAGVSLVVGRRFIRAIVALPKGKAEELLAEARRELIREMNAQLRRAENRRAK